MKITLLDSLNSFNDFINGDTNYTDLENHMSYYDNKWKSIKLHFYKKIGVNKEIYDKIKQILTNLNLNEEEQKIYLNDLANISICEFFIKLKNSNHIQIEHILELIEEKKRNKRIFQLILASMVLFPAIGLISVTILPVVATLLSEFIHTILLSTLSLPIFGIIYNTGLSLFNLYLVISNPKETISNRIRDSVFTGIKLTPKLIGYGIWIASGMSPIVAGMFILSSCIDVVQESVRVIQEHHHYMNRKSLNTDTDPLILNKNYLRIRNGFELHRNALIINIAIAVIFVGIVVAWNFIPGGIAVTALLVTATIVTMALKIVLLKINEINKRNSLQRELEQINARYDEGTKNELELREKEANAPKLEPVIENSEKKQSINLKTNSSEKEPPQLSTSSKKKFMKNPLEKSKSFHPSYGQEHMDIKISIFNKTAPSPMQSKGFSESCGTNIISTFSTNGFFNKSSPLKEANVSNTFPSDSESFIQQAEYSS